MNTQHSPAIEKTNSLQKITEGVRRFQSEAFAEKRALFQSLAQKQQPKILFITCSDSRVDPSLITQTEPGDLFVIQNAGNIVPPYGVMYGGTSASVEFAVAVLNVEHIIICGHSDCGAMRALVKETPLEEAPTIQQWLRYAQTAKAIIDAEMQTQPMNEAEQIYRCSEKNVEVQLNHLKTIPCVAAHMASGKLQLHGWLYHIGTGKIRVFSNSAEQFMEFDQAY